MTSSDSHPGPSTGQVRLLIPVKAFTIAKSRLRSAGPFTKPALVEAFAADTVTAALACSRVGAVYVVTNDSRARRLADSLGAGWLADRGEGDLNRALRAAAAALDEPEEPIAAMCADLPCLSAEDLSAGLLPVDSPQSSQPARAGFAVSGAWFVADRSGRGTSLLLAASARDFRPRFGVDSALAHLALGARRLDGGPTLRLDVDTADDLADAVALGVGPHTARVLIG